MIRVIKSRRMRWAGHVACMTRDMGGCWGNLKEGPLGRPRRGWKDSFKDAGCDGVHRDHWQTCEHGSELSGSVKGGRIREQLSD